MRFVQRLFNPSPRGKLRWTAFLVFLLFVVTAGYNATEFYNQKRDAWNKDIDTVGFLKWVDLPALNVSAWPPNAFRLGLDLKGGTHLVYSADVSKVPDGERGNAIEGVRDVIERRVNTFGVSEPVVQTIRAGDDYRVVVELAGIKDVNQAIKMIGDTPQLEFKEQGAEERKLTPAQEKELKEFNEKAAKKTAEALAKARVGGADFAGLVRQYTDDTATKDKGGDIGWVSQYNREFAFMEAVAAKTAKGVVAPALVAGPGGNNIIKVTDIRSSEKEVSAAHLLICFDGAASCEKKTTKDDARKMIDDLKKQATPTNFVDLVKKNSTEPGAAERGGDLGWFGKGVMVKEFEEVAFKIAKNTISDVIETPFGFHIIFKKDEKPLTEYQVARILVNTKTAESYLPPPSQWKSTQLTGTQLKRASVQFNQNNSLPEVNLEFNEEGTKLFGEITKRNVGNPVAIFLDGQPISTPRVQQAITDGNAVIQGDFDVKEAKLLAQRLNAGALPVPVSLVSQQTVGASLGEESLQKSLMAGLIGFLLVALFMVALYRLPGLLAVVALIIYSGIVLAIFKVWPVTLTLSGIAGFILSVGMAVDANVLIFERMKEELRKGKSLETALRDGFARAWTSIRDSNVSSLITCGILFFFSASLIKGFALTLAIGILVSMFSAIFITRILLQLAIGGTLREKLWLFTAAPASTKDEKAA